MPKWGQLRPTCAPVSGSILAEMGLDPSDFRRSRARCAQLWGNFDQNWRRWLGIEQVGEAFGRRWADVGPLSTEFGPGSTEFGPTHRRTSVNIGPGSAKLGPTSTQLGPRPSLDRQSASISKQGARNPGQIGPDSVQRGPASPKLGPAATKIGPSPAKAGLQMWAIRGGGKTIILEHRPNFSTHPLHLAHWAWHRPNLVRNPMNMAGFDQV